MKVTIIGAGVIGTSLGVLLRRAGYEIAAISSRNRRSAQLAANHIGQGEVVGDPGLAAMGADIVVLAVPDRIIPSIALEVSAGGALKRGAVVTHLAGSVPASVLTGVRAAGGWCGAMHPLQSFADVDAAIQSLPDTFFFMEGDAEAVDVLRSLVIAIGGKPVTMDSQTKALYHAGAVVASNFLVALAHYAVQLFKRAGVPHEICLPALLPLIKGTVANLEEVGLPDALTGPIARGDVGTVKRHVNAMEGLPGDLLGLYRSLARKTIEVAVKKGDLDQNDLGRILELLSQGVDPIPGMQDPLVDDDDDDDGGADPVGV